MRKKLTIALLALFPFFVGYAQHQPTASAEVKIVTFTFLPGEDDFFASRGNNGAELERLYETIGLCYPQIASGAMHLYVDGYCSSGADAASDFKIAVIRSNRVKSMLMLYARMKEENFVTKNHVRAYEGHKDLVVVRVPVPVAPKPAPVVEPKPVPRVEPVPEPVSEPKPQPVAEPQPQPESVTAVRKEVQVVRPVDPWREPYCIAIRTNLLYDAFVVPTLGIEWRASRSVGIKIDGSRIGWGNEHSQVQKLWMVNPEIRWYMGGAKRFYLGLGATAGEYNLYKKVLGSLISDDTGYQGNVYGGGLTVGYQARLSRYLSLDLNLGLGYAQFNYDSFTVIDETRVYKEKDQTKNWYGPTQAGVSLVWRLGGEK